MSVEKKQDIRIPPKSEFDDGTYRKRFRYVAHVGMGRDLMKAQDRLMKTFKETEDGVTLRKDFYNLRLRYLEGCLSAYATDLKQATLLDVSELREFIKIKLDFYTKRFKIELGRLFPEAPWKNRRMSSQFKKDGNKLLDLLTERI